MDTNNWLVRSIKEKMKLDDAGVEKLVREKIALFPSLNEDAAVRMVATENGIVPIQRVFKAGEINKEINHVDISGTISRKFPTRQVNLSGRSAKLLKFSIFDETGEISVVVWDTNKIDALENFMREGDRVTIVNGYSRKNKFNDMYEIHIGRAGIVNIDSSKADFVRLSNVSKGKRNTVMVFLTRMFTDNTFLVKCTICNKRVIDKCDIHGDKALSKVLMLTGIVDDGLSNMRASFFDKVAEKLLSLASGDSIEEKVRDLSFGLYQLELTATVNDFNGNISLTVKDVVPVRYDIG